MSGSKKRGLATAACTSRSRRRPGGGNHRPAGSQRQLNDPYVRRAKIDGYRSRAAYKLIEIDDKHKLLKPGYRVVDLGCAPGGWCQIAVDRVKSTIDSPKVVGIDYLDMDHVRGAVFLKKDFLDDDAPAALMEALGGHKPDVVLSDMAAPTTAINKLTICAPRISLRSRSILRAAISFPAGLSLPRCSVAGPRTPCFRS
jgi:23S rRNA (uridine2552-2'-O)-methyltransferase